MLLNTMNVIGKFNLPIGENDRLLDMIIIINAIMVSVRVMLVVSPALKSEILAKCLLLCIC
jgi:hypothetical protein